MQILSKAQYQAIIKKLEQQDQVLAAIMAQMGELHGRINKTLSEVDQLHQRISFDRRPRP